MLNMLDMLTMIEQRKKTVNSEEEIIKSKIEGLDLKSIFLAKKFRRSQSYSTKHGYGIAIDRFTEFCRLHYNLNLEQLIQAIKTEKLDPLNVLDDYYTFLTEYKRPKGKTGFAAGSMRTYITIAKEFFFSQGIKLYNEEVKQRLRLPQQDDRYEEGLTKETINRVIRASSLKLATVILLACSSGMRLGEIVQLKLSDINFDTNPITITIRKETTKTRQRRTTHSSTEATSSLKDYLASNFGWKEDDKKDRFLYILTHEEKIEKHKADLADPKTDKRRIHLLHRYIDKLQEEIRTLSPEERYARAVTFAKATLEESIRSVIKDIPDLGIRVNDRYQIHFHAFRAWFKTQVTDAHQSDYAEALMGHKSLKMTYYRQNHEKREKVYRNVEPFLTISGTEKMEKNLEQLQDSETELREELRDTKREYREEFRVLKEMILEIQNGYRNQPK